MFRFAEHVFRAAASLALAVFVILALAAYLAAATLYESRFGATAAQKIVYASPVFVGLFVLLAINVMASAAIRFPWKRHQTGFVVTHIGIEILLLGCLIGQRYGVDGRFSLGVGESAAALLTRNEVLHVATSHDGNGPIRVVSLENLYHEKYPSLGRFLLSALARTKTEAAASDPFSKRARWQIATLDTDLRISVLQWLPAAKRVKQTVGPRGRVVEALVAADVEPAKIDQVARAVHVEFERGDERVAIWLERQSPAVVVPMAKGDLQVAYVNESVPLPATVKLRSVGDERVVIESDGGEINVAPNAPATLAGHTIYLSGTATDDAGVPMAFFNVRYDPGRPVKYAGCAGIVAGTVILFVRRRPAAIEIDPRVAHSHGKRLDSPA